MTRPADADVPVTFIHEHKCNRLCRTEIDLEGYNLRYTLGQMIRTAQAAHAAAHDEPPCRVYVHGGGLLVRAGTPTVSDV